MDRGLRHFKRANSGDIMPEK